MHAPCTPHLQLVKMILRYVKVTLHYCQHLYTDSNFSLTAYSDSNWVGCKETRRSTTRFCTFLVKNCISWSAKKQVTLSRSNTKAEYKAMAITAVELTWLTYVLKDVVVSMKSTPMLY